MSSVTLKPSAPSHFWQNTSALRKRVWTHSRGGHGMAKMTLEDLRKLRETKRQDMDMRSPDNKDVDIIVSMGTSGIAAGAKDTLKAFVEELEKRGLTNVAVRQVGGMGLDHAEPTVEVR